MLVSFFFLLCTATIFTTATTTRHINYNDDDYDDHFDDGDDYDEDVFHLFLYLFLLPFLKKVALHTPCMWECMRVSTHILYTYALFVI